MTLQDRSRFDGYSHKDEGEGGTGAGGGAGGGAGAAGASGAKIKLFNYWANTIFLTLTRDFMVRSATRRPSWVSLMPALPGSNQLGPWNGLAIGPHCLDGFFQLGSMLPLRGADTKAGMQPATPSGSTSSTLNSQPESVQAWAKVTRRAPARGMKEQALPGHTCQPPLCPRAL